jgi:hypothetical protein
LLLIHSSVIRGMVYGDTETAGARPSTALWDQLRVALRSVYRHTARCGNTPSTQKFKSCVSSLQFIFSLLSRSVTSCPKGQIYRRLEETLHQYF